MMQKSKQRKIKHNKNKDAVFPYEHRNAIHHKCVFLVQTDYI